MPISSRTSATARPSCPRRASIPATPLVATSHPRNSWPKTVIYEAHVRGLTMRHPFLAEEVRGTFAADLDAGHDRLSRTPRHHGDRVHAGPRLRPGPPSRRARPFQLLGLQHARPSSRPSRAISMAAGLEDIAIAVDRLHQSGIEVILDVVYNHTCEGNHLGPTLSWRGHRQRVLLPPAARRSALLRQSHGLRQRDQHRSSARPADGAGQPAHCGRRSTA